MGKCECFKCKQLITNRTKLVKVEVPYKIPYTITKSKWITVYKFLFIRIQKLITVNIKKYNEGIKTKSGCVTCFPSLKPLYKTDQVLVPCPYSEQDVQRMLDDALEYFSDDNVYELNAN